MTIAAGKRKRLPVVSIMFALALGAERRAFDPTDCRRCQWNHEAFSDDFPKTGHCYMFADAPQRQCGQRKERAA